VALVAAETFEAARDAAPLIAVAYNVDPHCTDIERRRHEAYVPPKKRSGVPRGARCIRQYSG
jgi:xanthine dehydrogenase YagR molybdenum-binding subunit